MFRTFMLSHSSGIDQTCCGVVRIMSLETSFSLPLILVIKVIRSKTFLWVDSISFGITALG